MSIEDYESHILELSKRFGYSKNDFVDIEAEILGDEYIRLIEFYSKTLDINSFHGISPSFIAVYDDTVLNAWAINKDGNNLILLFKGLIHYLINTFMLNDDLNKEDIRILEILKPHLNTSISNLMYDASIHFTFYHEMAHLIQYSGSKEGSLDEVPKFTNPYDQESHILELDADEFSSLCLSEHILQYHSRLFKKGNSGTYEGLLVLFLAPIVLYLLAFSTNKSKLYFYEGSHPHPIIRLMLITLTITDYCKMSLLKYEQDIEIDHLAVIENALVLAQEIEQRYLSSNKVQQLIVFIKDNLDEIMEYVEEMRKIKKNFSGLAIDSWNRHSNK